MANAASLFLVPITPTTNVANGDIVSFEIHMDFSGDPTLGGAFNLHFDPGALQFVSFYRDESVGDPQFGRDPDIFDGRLEAWGVGDLNGLPEVAVLGNVVFQVLPTMEQDTTLFLGSDKSICGCWVSTDLVSPIYPEYGSANVSRVPLPAAGWFMLSAALSLLALRQRQSTAHKRH